MFKRVEYGPELDQTADTDGYCTSRLANLAHHIYDTSIMDVNAAVTHLMALAHETRLGIFRLLVRSGPEGMCVSDIGSKLKIAPTTLSFHLKELTQAKLIKARPEGRFVFYSADFKRMNALLRYLTEHCCEGQPCEASETVTCQET